MISPDYSPKYADSHFSLGAIHPEKAKVIIHISNQANPKFRIDLDLSAGRL